MSKSKEHLSKFLFIVCILGTILCVYLVIDSIKKQEWGDAFVGIALGLACFANPLYEGIKRYRK